MNGKRGSLEISQLVVIVLLFFALVVLIIWVQGSFRSVSGPTSEIGKNISNSSPSVINMINTWNLTG